MPGRRWPRIPPTAGPCRPGTPRDEPVPPSAVATFETGLAGRGWTASWIRRVENETEEPDQYTYARREFVLGVGAIDRARAYVSGDQQYELYVNGERAGKGQAYSYPDSKYYETLDLTRLLRPGSVNAVGILCQLAGTDQGPSGRRARGGGRRSSSTAGTDASSGWSPTDRGGWPGGPGSRVPSGTSRATWSTSPRTSTVRPNRSGGTDRASTTAAGRRRRGAGPARRRHHGPTWCRCGPASSRSRCRRSPSPPCPPGALVADFGKVYAAVPTVRFHHGVAGRLVTMRAGFLLDQPVAGQPFDGVPGQVSAAHGTQHTDMSYTYVQRGGEEQFHPFDYLGFRYFQIDDPGEDLQPGDVVALARHTAMPDQAPATFSSSEATIDAEFQLGAHSALYTAQEQFIDTPTREKGSWLFDGFNESRDGDGGVRGAEPHPQVAGRVRPVPEAVLAQRGGQQDLPDRSRAPSTSTSRPRSTSSGYGSTGCTPVTGPWSGRSTGWSQRIADYVQRAVGRRHGLVTSLPATNIYYDYPVVTRLNVLGVNVFRRAAALGDVLGRPAGRSPSNGAGRRP